jgi:sigma-B regulation protein RsbQ
MNAMQNILARNNVTVSGNGEQALLLAHGFGCDQNMWRFITPAFANDYRLILFDYVGSGKSDSSAYRSERYNDLRATRRTCSTSAPRWICKTSSSSAIRSAA